MAKLHFPRTGKHFWSIIINNKKIMPENFGQRAEFEIYAPQPKELLWKQIKTGLICSVFSFLFVFFVMNEMESRRLRHMPFITANALNYSYHPVRLPLKTCFDCHGRTHPQHLPE